MARHGKLPIFLGGLCILSISLAAQDAKKPEKSKPPEIQPLQTLVGHEADVYSVRFSPDDGKVATASFDKTIKIWDATSGKEIATLTGHQGKVLSLAFSSDSRALLSGSEDKTLKLWDVPGEGAVSFSGHGGAVESMALSPDSSFLATASADGTIRLWNRASRKEALKLEPGAGPIHCLAFTADGKRLATGGADKSVRLWDVSSVTAPPPAPAAAAGAMEILKQGASWKYFKGKAEPPAEWKNAGFDDSKWESGASGFGYSSMPEELQTIGTKLEDMMNGYLSVYTRAVFKIEDPKKLEKLSLRVLIDDGMVAYLNGQEVGRDNIDGSPPAHDTVAKSSHEALAVDIDLTPHIGKLTAEGNVLAVQGHNHELESSDLVLTATLSGVFKAGEKKPEPPAPKLDLAKLDGAGGAVLAVAWSPDGAWVAAGGEDKQVRIWKSADGSVVKSLDQGGAVRGLAFIDGDQLAVAGDGGAIKIWAVGEGKATKSLEGHQGNVLALAVRADRSQLLSGGDDKTLRLWDAAGAKELKSFAGHEAAVTCVAFAADPKLVVSGGTDKTVRAWSIESGKEARKFTQSAEVRSVAGGPSERYYSSGQGNDALEWRLVSVEAVRTFSGHGGAVHSVAFSPDGATVASSSGDKLVKLWNRGDGKEIRSINAHDSSVYTIAFNQDGSLLASGGFDRTVKIWKTADGSMVKKLEGHGEGVFCLKFSSDGQFIYSGSSDRTIRKWNVSDGMQVAVLEGHPGWVSGISLFPGDAKLASIDYGGNLITWNLADGKLTSQRKVPDLVYDLSISTDGKRFATANRSRNAFILDAEAK